MPPTNRLTSPADFRRTYAEGRRVGTSAVVAHVRDSGDPRPARVGVSANRGIGGAVVRNRAKRRLREAIRALRVPLKPGVDAVLVATPSSGSLPFQNLVVNVEKALARSGGFGG